MPVHVQACDTRFEAEAEASYVWCEEQYFDAREAAVRALECGGVTSNEELLVKAAASYIGISR